MLTCLPATEEIERLPGCDVPGGVECREQASNVRRMPSVPARDVGLESLRAGQAQIQWRQRKSATCAIVDATMSALDAPSVQ